MKLLLTILCLWSIALLTSCDMRSGTAKQEMDKFSGTRTPTPTVSPTPEATPIDPADIVQVDTTLDGDILTVNSGEQKKTLTCKKFDRVMINATGSIVTINGACRQIIVNGNENQVTADAAMEFIFNGSGNSVKYARFVNGKRSTVTDNRSGNDVEKIAQQPQKSDRTGSKDGK